MIGVVSDKKMESIHFCNLKRHNLILSAMLKKVVYLKEECEEANNNEDGLLKEYSQEVVFNLPGY